MAPPKKNLKDQRFGRWLVVGDREIRQPGKYKLVFYRCRCDCGKEALVQQSNLLSGGSQSCGCLSSEIVSKRMRLEPGQASTNQVLRYYQTNARRRGLSWELSLSDFQRLIQGSCGYCGSRDSMTAIKHKDKIAHNGIDRVNPALGYTVENCVSCCKTCNNAKSDMTVDQFLGWLARAYVVTQNRFTA